MTKTYELPNKKIIMADVDEKYHTATVIVYALDDLVEAVNKTGHWIYICNSEVNGLKIVKCSECGKRTYGSGKYCPNCGAKMESEE